MGTRWRDGEVGVKWAGDGRHCTVAVAVAAAVLRLLLRLLSLLASNSPFVASPKGRRTGCAAVSAEPWMANRECAYSLSGRGIDLGKWKALSFGYF
jgi:hypothetical protein